MRKVNEFGYPWRGCEWLAVLRLTWLAGWLGGRVPELSSSKGAARSLVVRCSNQRLLLQYNLEGCAASREYKHVSLIYILPTSRALV